MEAGGSIGLSYHRRAGDSLFRHRPADSNESGARSGALGSRKRGSLSGSASRTGPTICFRGVRRSPLTRRAPDHDQDGDGRRFARRRASPCRFTTCAIQRPPKWPRRASRESTRPVPDGPYEPVDAGAILAYSDGGKTGGGRVALTAAKTAERKSSLQFPLQWVS